MTPKNAQTPNRLPTLVGATQRVRLAGSPPIDTDLQRWEREVFFQPRPFATSATPQRSRRVALLLALCVGLGGAVGTAAADSGSGPATGDSVASSEGSLWDWFLISIGLGDPETLSSHAKGNETPDPDGQEP